METVSALFQTQYQDLLALLVFVVILEWLESLVRKVM